MQHLFHLRASDCCGRAARQQPTPQCWQGGRACSDIACPGHKLPSSEYQPFMMASTLPPSAPPVRRSVPPVRMLPSHHAPAMAATRSTTASTTDVCRLRERSALRRPREGGVQSGRQRSSYGDTDARSDNDCMWCPTFYTRRARYHRIRRLPTGPRSRGGAHRACTRLRLRSLHPCPVTPWCGVVGLPPARLATLRPACGSKHAAGSVQRTVRCA